MIGSMRSLSWSQAFGLAHRHVATSVDSPADLYYTQRCWGEATSLLQRAGGAKQPWRPEGK